MGHEIRGVYAMGLSEEFGSIAIGKRANLQITERIPSIDYIPYAYTRPIVSKVFIGGKEII